jgi:myosin-9
MEQLRCLYVMVELLPKAHKALLDRLMYHLARIAHHEEVDAACNGPQYILVQVNKMGTANLATIFAPCLLRRAQNVHAQEQLQDVNKCQMYVFCGHSRAHIPNICIQLH